MNKGLSLYDLFMKVTARKFYISNQDKVRFYQSLD